MFGLSADGGATSIAAANGRYLVTYSTPNGCGGLAQSFRIVEFDATGTEVYAARYMFGGDTLAPWVAAADPNVWLGSTNANGSKSAGQWDPAHVASLTQIPILPAGPTIRATAVRKDNSDLYVLADYTANFTVDGRSIVSMFSGMRSLVVVRWSAAGAGSVVWAKPYGVNTNLIGVAIAFAQGQLVVLGECLPGNMGIANWCANTSTNGSTFLLSLEP